jgi:hypothetical protein
MMLQIMRYVIWYQMYNYSPPSKPALAQATKLEESALLITMPTEVRAGELCKRLDIELFLKDKYIC